jgi:hypothetical protein
MVRIWVVGVRKELAHSEQGLIGAVQSRTHVSMHPTIGLKIGGIRIRPIFDEAPVVVGHVNIAGDAELPEIVHATDALAFGFGQRESRKKQGSQNCNNCDHDENFYQRKS